MQNHRIRPLMKCLTGLVLILGMVALAMVFPVTGRAEDAAADVSAVPAGHISSGNDPSVYNYRDEDDAGLSTEGLSSLPQRYDLRAIGQSTSVKMQGPFETCWSFGNTASLESNLMKTGQWSGEPDLSEHQADYFVFQPVNGEGLLNVISNPKMQKYANYSFMLIGGNRQRFTQFMSCWRGVAEETAIPYTNRAGAFDPQWIANEYKKIGDWTLDTGLSGQSAVRIANADFLPEVVNKSEDDEITYDTDAVAAIKQKVMDTGGVDFAYKAENLNPEHCKYTNSDWYTYDNNLEDFGAANHEVCIVGWDDTVAPDKFGKDEYKNYQGDVVSINPRIQPPGPGAWIVKNSYGTDVCQTCDYGNSKGYFYMSYYDVSSTEFASQTAEVKSASGLYRYDNNYQYDYLGIASDVPTESGTDPCSVANVFTAKGDENLKAVSAFTTAPGSAVHVQVVLPDDPAVPDAGKVVAEQTATEAFGGYHTIQLDTPVDLGTGQTYAVIETITYTEDGATQYLFPVEQGTGDYLWNNSDPHLKAITETATIGKGQSYYKKAGVWKDLADEPATSKTVMDATGETTVTVNLGNAEVKAFTTNLPMITDLGLTAYDKDGVSLGRIEGSAGTTVSLPYNTAYVSLNPTVTGGTLVSMTAGGKAFVAGEKISLSDFQNGVVLTISSLRGEERSKTVAFTLENEPSPKTGVDASETPWAPAALLAAAVVLAVFLMSRDSKAK
jgi:C1A family cysteine protease